VELTGDAFFDVRRDTLRPFHVSTANMRLTVLGTEFAVSEGAGVVSMYEGSVSVDAGATTSTLSWGERLTYDAATGRADVSVIPPREMMAAGYKPRLIFDRSTLGEVLDALSFSFGVEIVTAADVNRDDGELTLSLENMARPQAFEFLIRISRENLSYTSVDGVITITRNAN
jgi:ferric-dicitrate binding protein FerR (iron transport regulator)